MNGIREEKGKKLGRKKISEAEIFKISCNGHAAKTDSKTTQTHI